MNWHDLYIIYEDQDKFLGEGSFGKVYPAQRMKDRQEMCAKKIQKKMTFGVYETIETNEFEITSKMIGKPFENLVQTFDCFLGDGKTEFAYIFMERCTNNLKKLNFLKDDSLDYQLIDQLIKQIANGYKELIELNLIHRDLKPENILYNENKNGTITFKIADFGLSKLLDSQQIQKTKNIGTPLYKAPEVATPDYDNRCDLYSLGIIIFEILIGENKFEKLIKELSKNKSELQDKQFSTIYQEYLMNIKQEYVKLLDKLIAFNPNQRISWEKLTQWNGELTQWNGIKQDESFQWNEEIENRQRSRTEEFIDVQTFQQQQWYVNKKGQQNQIFQPHLVVQQNLVSQNNQVPFLNQIPQANIVAQPNSIFPQNQVAQQNKVGQSKIYSNQTIQSSQKQNFNSIRRQNSYQLESQYPQNNQFQQQTQQFPLQQQQFPFQPQQLSQQVYQFPQQPQQLPQQTQQLPQQTQQFPQQPNKFPLQPQQSPQQPLQSQQFPQKQTAQFQFQQTIQNQQPKQFQQSNYQQPAQRQVTQLSQFQQLQTNTNFLNNDPKVIPFSVNQNQNYQVQEESNSQIKQIRFQTVVQRFQTISQNQNQLFNNKFPSQAFQNPTLLLNEKQQTNQIPPEKESTISQLDNCQKKNDPDSGLNSQSTSGQFSSGQISGQILEQDQEKQK